MCNNIGVGYAAFFIKQALTIQEQCRSPIYFKAASKNSTYDELDVAGNAEYLGQP